MKQRSWPLMVKVPTILYAGQDAGNILCLGQILMWVTAPKIPSDVFFSSDSKLLCCCATWNTCCISPQKLAHLGEHEGVPIKVCKILWRCHLNYHHYSELLCTFPNFLLWSSVLAEMDYGLLHHFKASIGSLLFFHFLDWITKKKLWLEYSSGI